MLKRLVRQLLLKLLRPKPLIVILVGFLIIFVFFFSGFFNLKSNQIHLTGLNSYISKTKVQNVLNEQVGKQLLFTGGDDLKKGLLKIAGIKNVQIQRRWPDGLLVAVLPSRVNLQVKTSEKQYRGIDEVGRLLDPKTKPLKNIAYLTSDLKKKLAFSELLKVTNSVYVKLNKTTRQSITSWHADINTQISCKLDNFTVIWGDGSDLSVKISSLKVLLKNRDALNGVRIINLSSPTRPTLKR